MNYTLDFLDRCLTTELVHVISSYIGYKKHPLVDVVTSREYGSKRVDLVHRWRVIAHNQRLINYHEEGEINPEDQN